MTSRTYTYRLRKQLNKLNIDLVFRNGKKVLHFRDDKIWMPYKEYLAFKNIQISIKHTSMNFTEKYAGLSFDAMKEKLQDLQYTACRPSWQVEWTNSRIFMEENKPGLWRTTGDWPAPYYPSQDEKDATDWLVGFYK